MDAYYLTNASKTLKSTVVLELKDLFVPRQNVKNVKFLSAIGIWHWTVVSKCFVSEIVIKFLFFITDKTFEGSYVGANGHFLSLCARVIL